MNHFEIKKPLTKEDSELLFDLASYFCDIYEEASKYDDVPNYSTDNNVAELDDLFKKYID
jgi:hypothetical protein